MRGGYVREVGEEKEEGEEEDEDKGITRRTVFVAS
jgi:hypothetical protein